MSLSDPAPRTALHRRLIDCNGYERDDGLWDIEGRLTDTKAYELDNEWRGRLAPGVPIHDMHVRLTLDDDFTVRHVEVAMDGTPFAICSDIEPDFAKLEGTRIAAGWSRELAKLFGGTKGCTHVVELLGRMGTVAFQTIAPVKARRQQESAESADGSAQRPSYLNGCHAWASDGPVVRKLLPEYYEGPDTPAPETESE